MGDDLAAPAFEPAHASRIFGYAMVTVMTDVATDPLAGFEWPSPEVIECPYAFYKALRDEAPIYRLPNGQYVVSRYADVLKVVRTPRPSRA